MSAQQLIDIAEPPPVPWTPQTVGWGVLAAVLLVVAAVIARALLRRHAANRYRREALAELDALAPPTVSGVNEILKRTAMVAYSRDAVAPLAGGPWVEFLRGRAARASLTEMQAELLADGGYSLRNREGGELVLFARQWIRNHERDRAGAR